MIRCMACQPPIDWSDLAIATRHVELMHWDLLEWLGDELALAELIARVLRRVD